MLRVSCGLVKRALGVEGDYSAVSGPEASQVWPEFQGTSVEREMAREASVWLLGLAASGGKGSAWLTAKLKLIWEGEGSSGSKWREDGQRGVCSWSRRH